MTQEFKYNILPSRPRPNARCKVLYNQVYDLWLQHMVEITEGSIPLDHFLNCDFIIGITHKDLVVACHMYSLFDLDLIPTRHKAYLSGLNQSSWDFLKQNNYSKLMSLEYLTVHPEFRKRIIGFSLADTLIALGLKCLKTLNHSAVIGYSRTDLGVDKAAEKSGAINVQSGIIKFGNPCNFQVVPADHIQPHPNEKVRSIIEDLWSRRVDHSNRTLAPERAKEIYEGSVA